MNIVNGFPCRDCADVSLAKRGVDPSRPQDDPQRPENAGRKRDPFGQAVSFGGASDNRDVTRSGSDRPGRGVGGAVDVSA